MALQLDASQYFRLSGLGGRLKAGIGYSACVWARPTFASDANSHVIMDYGVNAGVEPFAIQIDATGGNYHFSAYGNAAGTSFAATTTAATQNDWFFCVATVFGTATNLYVYHYTGGTMSGPFGTTTGTATADTDSTSSLLYIGASRAASSKWQGNIYGFVLWLAALTQQEATAMAFGASPRTIRPKQIAVDVNFNLNGFNQDGFQSLTTRGFGTQNQMFNITGGFASPDVELQNPPPAGLGPYINDNINQPGWDQQLPIISQTARRPFPLPLQSLIGVPVASSVDFRKTLSGIGGRIGSRQIQGWGG